LAVGIAVVAVVAEIEAVVASVQRAPHIKIARRKKVLIKFY
jgi:hypothetical protein